MHPRARALIDTLRLQAHPEGGWFAEVFRSVQQVQPQDERPSRSALTSIYFLLETHQQSSWHRVRSDEVWVYLEGDALHLWHWNGLDETATCTLLGPVDVDRAQRPQHIIAAGHWQAARPVSLVETASKGYALVACMVGPGFDFADFSLLHEQDAEAEFLLGISL
jgi:predicted cupin superfamily sugar epimerase